MAELLSADQVAAGIAELDGWSGDTRGITRTTALPTFLDAIAVVDQVAAEAEAADHHPDIDIRWRNLTFTCATHTAGGVTSLDLVLAKRIDEIVGAAVK
jgi:4a-hydroxytetrahydrobiopterin dehydratase